MQGIRRASDSSEELGKFDNKTKRQLAEATMKLVAENGMDHFSMKAVTKTVGVAESLIYKYFDTKDNLLNTCFAEIERQVFQQCKPIVAAIERGDNTKESLRKMWIQYFRFFVDNDYRSLFYFIYRDLHYANHRYGGLAIGAEADDHSGWNRLRRIKQDDLFWIYLSDTTDSFIKRVIGGQVADTNENIEKMWRYISAGI